MDGFGSAAGVADSVAAARGTCAKVTDDFVTLSDAGSRFAGVETGSAAVVADPLSESRFDTCTGDGVSFSRAGDPSAVVQESALAASAAFVSPGFVAVASVVGDCAESGNSKLASPAIIAPFTESPGCAVDAIGTRFI